MLQLCGNPNKSAESNQIECVESECSGEDVLIEEEFDELNQETKQNSICESPEKQYEINEPQTSRKNEIYTIRDSAAEEKQEMSSSQHFLMSLVDVMESLPTNQNLLARIKIQQLLYDLHNAHCLDQ